MLTDRLQQQIQVAMKGGDNLRLSTLRLLYSALHNEQIAKMRELSSEEEISIIRRQLKQRQEAIEAYEKGGRAELAEKERVESKILQEFLPAEMSAEEIEQIAEQIIADLGTGGASDFGKVMGAVMGKVKGQADGSTVSRIVREKLLSSRT
ncbi:MAG: GatB/YqeY domain-containing protein [Candidatus Blackburnbacteria bacterium]|nr:GatB/YqeY domain-containing protein [Candidatus Blackburnbacteria bacterium]